MAFDYDKLKSKENEENHWVSYSDLFMVLSTVFLLLFVVANIRSGTSSLQKAIEHNELQKRAEYLESEIKAYNILNDEYLEQNATEDEKKSYEMLMSKLDLLQDEASEERDRLLSQSKENEQKRKALNKYQSMIKGIIDSNVFAKNQIQSKDRVIIEKKVELTQSEQNLARSRQNLEKVQDEVFEKEKHIKMAEMQIQNVNTQLENQIKKLNEQRKKAHLNQKAYQARLEKIQKESLAKVKKIREEENKVKNELSAAQSKLKQAESEIDKVAQDLLKEKDAKQSLAQESEKQKEEFIATIDDLKQEKTELSKDLKKAVEAQKAKENFAKKIKDKLSKAGIAADVDAKTGDVVLSFGEEYFDTGSDKLKDGMKKKLTKFMPVYAETLLQDPKTASKIKNIEIVGFASSTFRNKYVNPRSLRPEDQEAIRFNLRLSYSRAQSIFDYAFDTQKMKFKHQKDILPKVKVSGQGFLPEGRNPASVPSGISSKEFCDNFDCKKSQRVIIRFDMNTN